jgi:hypothetical protein
MHLTRSDYKYIKGTILLFDEGYENVARDLLEFELTIEAARQLVADYEGQMG